MRRHLTSRILLSFLLLWQLGAGAFVHAHGHASGMAAMEMQHAAATLVEPAAADEEHCADHEAMMAGASMDVPADMQAHMAMDDAQIEQHGIEQHGNSHPECCQSLLCNCPCIQALALSLSLPYVPSALPNALPAQVVVAPLLNTGISDLFRPPI